MQRGASDRGRRSGSFPPLPVALGVAFIAMGLLDCSLLLNWGDYTGPTGEGDSDGEASDVVEAGLDVVDSGARSDASADAPRAELRCLSTSPSFCCVSAPPNGWTGPLAFYDGPFGAVVPSCGPDYPTSVFEGRSGLIAPPAACSTCTCDPPQGSACIAPTLTTYSDLGCRAPCGSSLTLSYKMCAAPSCTVQAVTVTPAGVDDAGSCVHSSVTATMQSVSWTDSVRACALASSPDSRMCRTDELLVPRPAMPFASRWCIMSSGEVSCPPGSEYSKAYTTHTNDAPQDTRGCSECSCDPPHGASCWISSPPAAGVAYDSMCNMPAIYQSFTVPASCTPVGVPLPPPVNFKLAQQLTLDAGSCTPDGGAPTGTVTPGPAVTFCCTP